jgi:tetratricopeptide (TPR) repeat protein
MLEIADGLNPYNARTISDLGGVKMLMGDHKEAEELCLRALDLDSTMNDPMYCLAMISVLAGRLPESFEYVKMQYRHGYQDSTYFRQAGDTYLDLKSFDLASAAYSFALDRGLDSAYVTAIKQRFPQIR